MMTETTRRLHRWSEDDEARRMGYLDAGLEPRLYRYVVVVGP